MDCVKCLEENNNSIQINGYGYGYIGKEYNCQRHNKSITTEKMAEGIKWSDKQPYERTKRCKH